MNGHCKHSLDAGPSDNSVTAEFRWHRSVDGNAVNNALKWSTIESGSSIFVCVKFTLELVNEMKTTTHMCNTHSHPHTLTIPKNEKQKVTATVTGGHRGKPD